MKTLQALLEKRKKIVTPSLVFAISLSAGCIGDSGSDKNSLEGKVDSSSLENAVYEIESNKNCSATFYELKYPEERFDLKQMPIPVKDENLRKTSDISYLPSQVSLVDGDYDIQINCSNQGEYEVLKGYVQNENLRLD